MLEEFYRRPASMLRLQGGPLSYHMPSIAREIGMSGFGTKYLQQKLRHVRLLDEWLGRRRLPISSLDETLVRRFLTSCRRTKRFRACSGVHATCATILSVLRKLGAIPTRERSNPERGLGRLEPEFIRYLVEERGLCERSIERYLGEIRCFAKATSPHGRLAARRIRPNDVAKFILARSRRFSQSGVALAATSLRAFLRFLYIENRITNNLAAAVPAVPSLGLSRTPVFLSPDEVEALLASLNRRTPSGARDYAMILILVRLGVRACEVARIALDDINWSSSRIRMPGAKAAPHVEYPMDRDVGQALAEYLRSARPKSDLRQVFLRANAPHVELRPSAVGKAVRRAIERAQLAPARKGAHVLRHSLATGMMRGGASLAEIAEVLRHGSLDATRIYAQVDFESLRQLAQRWPKGAA